MGIVKFETIESKLIHYNDQLVIIDSDVAQLYGVETRDVNKAVRNNPGKFPNGYVITLTKDELEALRWKFSTAKFNMTRVPSKVFTEKGLYMLATIIKSKIATETTLSIIETFAKVKELSRNINAIMKTEDGERQKELANKSNQLLEEIIEIESDILSDDEDGEIVETTTKFEFNLGFAKVSRSIKKIKK